MKTLENDNNCVLIQSRPSPGEEGNQFPRNKSINDTRMQKTLLEGDYQMMATPHVYGQKDRSGRSLSNNHELAYSSPPRAESSIQSSSLYGGQNVSFKDNNQFSIRQPQRGRKNKTRNNDSYSSVVDIFQSGDKSDFPSLIADSVIQMIKVEEMDADGTPEDNYGPLNQRALEANTTHNGAGCPTHQANKTH